MYVLSTKVIYWAITTIFNSDDEDDGNPLVAGDEDIDLDEFATENAKVSDLKESDEDVTDSDESEIVKDEDSVLQPEPVKSNYILYVYADGICDYNHVIILIFRTGCQKVLQFRAKI